MDLTIDADLEDEDTNASVNTSINSINRSDLYSSQQHEGNGISTNYGVDESAGNLMNQYIKELELFTNLFCVFKEINICTIPQIQDKLSTNSSTLVGANVQLLCGRGRRRIDNCSVVVDQVRQAVRELQRLTVKAKTYRDFSGAQALDAMAGGQPIY